MNINMDKILNEIKNLNNIHISWRDYCLMMLNSTAEPLRSIWREKLISSIIHTQFTKSSTCEGNFAGICILSELPNAFTLEITDDYFKKDSFKILGRLPRSKRMGLIIGHYPQESPSEEARLCIHYIIDNWNKYNYLIKQSSILSKMWDLSQLTHGKCLYPDEILTYTLENNIENSGDAWLNVVYNIFLNGIDNSKFKKYYFNNKIDNFPLTPPKDLETQKQYFLNFSDIFLKEDITSIQSWKRICICILKNDVSFSYAGFSKTYKERLAREQALAMFSLNKEEKDKSKQKLLQLLQDKNYEGLKCL